GEPVGERLAVHFDSGLASMNETSQQSIEAWVSKLGTPLSQIRFGLQGEADIGPVHSDLYPNNAALSRARAEAVAAWLVSKGARREAVTIESVGDTDPVALQQNRGVSVQAYAIESVRLPEVIRSKPRDLYHVDENRVFKVIDGVPGYKIGPGDELSMVFWQGGKSEEHKVTVQVDGTVSLPYQEALEVSGLTPREVDKYVTELLSRYEKRPRVDVLVLKARSKTANIFGEVQSLTRQPTGPGSYFMSGKESLVDLLSRAGGPGKDADLSNVQITRDGKTITLDLKRAIKQGDWTENAIIDDGDTIFIPSLAQSKHRVYVLGAVSKPGVVEFNGDMTFLDAVLKSGGLDKGASLPDIRVLRSDRDAPQILAVDFKRFMERGDLTQNIVLQDNDVLIVPRRSIANWNLYVQDLLPSIQLILAPVSIASQSLSIAVLSKQL
ncbi:MAG: SLBB domain-containing protein, partial [Mariprofundaceae bacterium]|nr:SLBB domain-containing protein [Mariprofundaceae bacterium]